MTRRGQMLPFFVILLKIWPSCAGSYSTLLCLLYLFVFVCICRICRICLSSCSKCGRFVWVVVPPSCICWLTTTAGALQSKWPWPRLVSFCFTFITRSQSSTCSSAWVICGKGNVFNFLHRLLFDQNLNVLFSWRWFKGNCWFRMGCEKRWFSYSWGRQRFS